MPRLCLGCMCVPSGRRGWLLLSTHLSRRRRRHVFGIAFGTGWEEGPTTGTAHTSIVTPSFCWRFGWRWSVGIVASSIGISGRSPFHPIQQSECIVVPRRGRCITIIKACRFQTQFPNSSGEQILRFCTRCLRSSGGMNAPCPVLTVKAVGG